MIAICLVILISVCFKGLSDDSDYTSDIGNSTNKPSSQFDQPSFNQQKGPNPKRERMLPQAPTNVKRERQLPVAPQITPKSVPTTQGISFDGFLK